MIFFPVQFKVQFSSGVQRRRTWILGSKDIKIFRNKIKMTGEDVCKFHKFGFCRKKKDCVDYHPIEVCDKKVCDLSKCVKRHPQACRYFEAGTCKFGDFCHYDHKKNNDEKLLGRIRKLENEVKRVTDINEKQSDNKERINKLENENKRIIDLNEKQADTILNLHTRMSHLEKEYVPY